MPDLQRGYIPRSILYADKERCFRMMERDLTLTPEQALKERARLIKNGTIVPFYQLKPQMLVRDASVSGGWRAI